MFTIPTIADFKAYFVRDFPYGSDPDECITDSDIQKALDEANYKINQSLFCDQKEFNIGFSNLAAHYLVMNIQSSSQGLSGKFEWLLGSKSVGSVSISQTIPESVLQDPNLAFYSKTGYGAKYLVMIYPKMLGSMFTVEGATLA